MLPGHSVGTAKQAATQGSRHLQSVAAHHTGTHHSPGGEQMAAHHLGNLHATKTLTEAGKRGHFTHKQKDTISKIEVKELC